MSIPEHHHRNTTKVSHKSFKSRLATKNSLRDKSKGKVEKSEKGLRKTPQQHVMSKLDRKNQNKQKRLASKQDYKDAQKIFMGRSGAPRVVTVVPLADDVSTSRAIEQLNSSLDIEQSLLHENHAAPFIVQIERFKQRLAYLMPQRDLFSILDACQVADYVVFVLSEGGMNESEEATLKTIESQGVSNVYFTVQGLDDAQAKKQQQIQLLLREQIRRYFPEQDLPVPLHSRQSCQNMIRSLCTSPPKGIKWREDRSWMMIESVRWASSKSQTEPTDTAEMIVTGVVRGNSLQTDRIMQVGELGEYQISRITAAPLNAAAHGKGNAMTVDSTENEDTLATPGPAPETLDELAPEEAVMEDFDAERTSVMASERKSVLLDDEYDHTIDEPEDSASKPKRLPRGTSKYQAAWYLDDISDSGSDLSDIEYEDKIEEDLAMDGLDARSEPLPAATSSSHAAPPSTVPDDNASSVSDEDISPASEEAIAAYRISRKTAASDDLSYPDEIELPPMAIARDRLARYRGLKNPKTSPWDPSPDIPHQPTEWLRLLDIHNHRAAYNRVLHEARYAGGIAPGTRVHVYLRNVPSSVRQRYEATGSETAAAGESKKPLLAISLLRHEHKLSATHLRIMLSPSCARPLKSKDPVVIQVGPRRFAANPVFSEPTATPNNVHRMLRYLHPGRTAVASVVAPVTWGACPVLVFGADGTPLELKAEEEGGREATMSMDIDTDIDSHANANADQSRASTHLLLLATGTTLPPSPARITAKRAILTGQPYKIHRRVVTVRYMFFNAGDVRYFSALPLVTNRGRKGRIREGLGTHGMFKAEFEGGVGAVESVGVHLWKRAWPRVVRRFVGGGGGAGASGV